MIDTGAATPETVASTATEDDVAEYLTPQDVADLIGVKVETIWRYSVRGAIPPPDHRFGNTPVWEPPTIAAWIATRTPKPKKTEKKGKK
jgi:predicted DNA-binding transcriptional regulator AlpA